MENINLYGNNFHNPSENILRQAEESIAKKELFEARVLLNNLIDANEYLPEAYNNLAVIDLLEYRYIDSLRHIISCINLDKGNIPAGDNLKYLERTLGEKNFNNLISELIEEDYRKAPLIIFIHIPKTAGTTFLGIIDKHYRKGLIYNHLSNCTPSDAETYFKQFKLMPLIQKMGYRVIPGHFPFGLNNFFPQPTKYVTFIRDPIERIISEYFFIRRSPDHMYYDELHRNNMSIEDLVTSGIYTTLDNGQTRMLAGLPAMKVEYGKCTKQMLVTAKKNLIENFALIGLTERFDETLLLIKKNLGWKNIFYPTKANESKNRLSKDELSNKTIAIIEKYNQLDIELYDFAQSLFQKSINDHLDCIEEDLKLFQLMNGVYHKAVDKNDSYFFSLESEYPLPIAVALYSQKVFESEGQINVANQIAGEFIKDGLKLRSQI